MNEVIQWSPGVSLEAIEQQVIQKAFQFYRENKSATARALGVSVRTLDDRLAKYKLDKESQETAEQKRKEDRAEWLDKSRGIAPAGQFDNTATKPVPEPMNGLNPTDWKPDSQKPKAASMELKVETSDDGCTDPGSKQERDRRDAEPAQGKPRKRA